MPSDVDIRDNAAAGRYELRVDGEMVGLADYIETADPIAAGGRRDVIHTEVDPAVGGRGLGSQLAAALLDDIRARGMRVTPSCLFIAAYIGDHPEYADLL